MAVRSPPSTSWAAQVGPESAGSEPGPACYGRGGTGASVTDADLVLGKLDPSAFAGGQMKLDLEAAQGALVHSIGEKLERSALQSAHTVSEVVNENMAAAARAHLAEWGKGAGGRSLIAFGGAAPLHACHLAHKLKISKIIVPADAGVGSAVGFLLAPVRYEVVRSHYMRLDQLDSAAVAQVMHDMREEAANVIGELVPLKDRQESAKAYMRYLGQGYEIAVTLDSTEVLDEMDLRARFEAEYRRLYGRTIPSLAVEVLSWTLSLSGPASGALGEDAVDYQRRVTASDQRAMFDVVAAASVQADCYQRERLRSGDWLSGPAVVLEAQTTTVVASGYSAAVSSQGHLVINREEGT